MLPDCLNSLFIKSFVTELTKYHLTFSFCKAFWGHGPGSLWKSIQSIRWVKCWSHTIFLCNHDFFNPSSVMYFGWVCCWRKQLFEGEGPFILLSYVEENYLGQNLVPVQKHIFFTWHKFCFSVLFPSKETICGAPALHSCCFSAGVCTASYLISLGLVPWLIVPSMARSALTRCCTCAVKPHCSWTLHGSGLWGGFIHTE